MHFFASESVEDFVEVFTVKKGSEQKKQNKTFMLPDKQEVAGGLLF